MLDNCILGYVILCSNRKLLTVLNYVKIYFLYDDCMKRSNQEQIQEKPNSRRLQRRVTLTSFQVFDKSL